MLTRIDQVERRTVTFVAQGSRALRPLVRAPWYSCGLAGLVWLGLSATLVIGSVAAALTMPSEQYQATAELADLFAAERGGCPECVDVFSSNDLARWESAWGGIVAQSATHRAVRVGIEGDSLTVGGAVVSGNLFRLLGSVAVRGRTLLPEDDDGEPAAVVSYSLWRTQFGRDPSVVGRIIRTVDGPSIRIVGVMGPGFAYPASTDIWLNRAADSHPPVGDVGQWLGIVRLVPGVTRESAREVLAARTGDARSSDGEARTGSAALVFFSGQAQAAENVALATPFWAFAALIALLTTLTAAALIVSRTTRRLRRDLVVRLALGATPHVLVLGVALEVAAVIAVGAMAAVVSTMLVVGPLESILSQTLNFSGSLQMEGLLLAAGGVAVLGLCGVAVSIPSRLIVDSQVSELLGASGARHSSVRSTTRLLRLIVVGQVGLTLVVSVAAMVFTRSVRHVTTFDIGFQREGLVVVPPIAPREHGQTSLTPSMFSLGDALARVPGVERVASLAATPLKLRFAGRVLESAPIVIEDQPLLVAPFSAYPLMSIAVSPGLFSVLGIPVRIGREFDNAEAASGDGVVIVNAWFAATFWPGESPLGKRLRISSETDNSTWRTVIGVTENTVPLFRAGVELALINPGREWPAVYVPLNRVSAVPPTIMLRTVAPIQALQSGIDEASVSAGFGGERPRSHEFNRWASVDRRVRQLAFVQKAATLVAFVLLPMSAICLAAVMLVRVRDQRREIGIRLALGASSLRVSTRVLLESAGLAAVGSVCGLLIGLGVGHLFSRFLYGPNPTLALGALRGVRHTDPVIWALCILATVAIALLAASVAVWRTTTFSPVEAIRHE